MSALSKKLHAKKKNERKKAAASGILKLPLNFSDKIPPGRIALSVTCYEQQVGAVPTGSCSLRPARGKARAGRSAVRRRRPAPDLKM